MENNYVAQAFELYLQKHDITVGEIENLQEAKTSLDSIVEQRFAGLQKYINKGNPNNFYVEKQKKHISELADVLETIKFYLYHPYLLRIHSEIVKLFEKDSKLNGFHISLQLKEGVENFAYINIPAKL